MAPIVHGLEAKYGDHLRFVYLDIDDLNTLSVQEAVFYERRWRPYIMLVDSDGNVILDSNGLKSIWIGVVPGEILELGILHALGY